MHYPVPNQFTIGDFEVGFNSSLSEIDVAFIARHYPGEEPDLPRLVIDGAAKKAAIGEHGEEDAFTFDVSQHGRYVLETSGQTDVVMVLLGPNNRTDVIAEDDDNGQDYNARIVTDLGPGTYYARVRHYWPTGSGEYEIKASSG